MKFHCSVSLPECTCCFIMFHQHTRFSLVEWMKCSFPIPMQKTLRLTQQLTFSGTSCTVWGGKMNGISAGLGSNSRIPKQHVMKKSLKNPGEEVTPGKGRHKDKLFQYTLHFDVKVDLTTTTHPPTHLITNHPPPAAQQQAQKSTRKAITSPYSSMDVPTSLPRRRN